jgi:hypothetical protein
MPRSFASEGTSRRSIWSMSASLLSHKPLCMELRVRQPRPPPLTVSWSVPARRPMKCPMESRRLPSTSGTGQSMGGWDTSTPRRPYARTPSRPPRSGPLNSRRVVWTLASNPPIITIIRDSIYRAQWVFASGTRTLIPRDRVAPPQCIFARSLPVRNLVYPRKR